MLLNPIATASRRSLIMQIATEEREIEMLACKPTQHVVSLNASCLRLSRHAPYDSTTRQSLAAAALQVRPSTMYRALGA